MGKLPAPLFSYFGSKIRLGEKYPAPKYDTIVEPFAGAAGYSRHHTMKSVVLYEKDPVIFAVLDYLIKATPEEILSLPLVYPWSLDEFPQLTNAQRWTIGFWLNFGLVKPGKSLCSWGRDVYTFKDARSQRNRYALWSEQCRARLAETTQEIKHWKVYQASWEDIDVLRYMPCTWFVDPPYQKEGGSYRYGNKIDYVKLAHWCQNLPGQVIVCEAAHATWLPFKPVWSQNTVGMRKQNFQEGIWINEEV